MGQRYRISHVGNFAKLELAAPTRSVSFIVPAFQAATTVADAIGAIRAAAPTDAEIVVVDDASFDDTATIARSPADRVLTRPCQGGAARCRNDGARIATGRVLCFVDADVIVEAKAVAGLLRHLDEGFDACFGAYTALPPTEVRNTVTNYKNILHHYTHAQNRGPARTFWSGFGAVSRHAFIAVDGFDVAVTTGADVEDIDLGYRLRAAGFEIFLDPDLEVRHRKRYTLRSLINSDIRHRAVPWSRTILKRRAFGGTLNVNREAMGSSIAALGAVAALAAAPFVGIDALLVAAFLMLVWIAANARFLAYVDRQWSAAGMVASTPLLFLYSLSSLLGAAGGFVAHLFRQQRTSGLNLFELEREPGDPDPLAVTVALVDLGHGLAETLAALGAPEPWWELLVVAPERPAGLPAGARFVQSPSGATRFELGEMALAAAEGDMFAIVDSGFVPGEQWLAQVRNAACRADLAVGGAFDHDKRSLRDRATQIAQFWSWRPECEPKWMSEHPLTNIAFRTDVARAVGGFQPALIARLNRFGARAIRFDPTMAVTSVGNDAYVDATRRIGATSRFQAASLSRYLDLTRLHRLAMVATSPFSGLRDVLQVIRSAIAEGSADANFWCSLPLSTVSLAVHWIGRDIGLVAPGGQGGTVLRTPEELAAVRLEGARLPQA